MKIISRTQYSQQIFLEDDIEVIAFQETYIKNEQELNMWEKNLGYDPMGTIYHRSYGTASYVRSDIQNALLISTSSSDNVFDVIVKEGCYHK